jgi:hypothetical protein
MNPRKLTLFSLLGLIVLIAGVSATIMISAKSAMNSAADYAAAHVSQLPIPIPLPGATPYAEPPVRVEAVARYGDTLEIQITRRYQTARNADAQFITTYFYQSVSGSWQLASAPANFWGDLKTTPGTRVLLRHPQRNQKLMDNLIKVIDPALAAACDQWHCPTDLAPLTLTFSTDPALVPDLSTYLVPQFTGLPLTLNANDDYLTAIAADSIRLLAQHLNLAPQLAEIEIQRQNLYTVH